MDPNNRHRTTDNQELLTAGEIVIFGEEDSISVDYSIPNVVSRQTYTWCQVVFM